MTLALKFMDRHRSLILLSLALACAIAAGPLKIFLQNREYFSITLSSVVLGSLCLFLVICALCAVVILAFGTRRQFVSTSLLLSLLTIYLLYETVFFVFVPELDGEASAVSSPLFYLIDIAAFGVIVFVFWLRGVTDPLVVSRTSSFVLLFIAIQIGVYASLPPADSQYAATLSDKHYGLSKDLNVIQVLFDTLQSTEFENEVREQRLSEELDGFTWFRNTLGIHQMTVKSLPGIFGGRIYAESELHDFYSGKDTTLLDVLAADNFDVNIYRLFDLPTSPDAKSWRTEELESDRNTTLTQFLQLFDVSLIRANPFVLKDLILDNYKFTFSELARGSDSFGNEIHRQAFLNFADRLHLVPGENVAKYYFVHLSYPHTPYTHNEDCGFAKDVIQPSPAQAQLEISCAIGDFKTLVERLKDLGVYDNTVILIHADTGMRPPSGLPVDGLTGSELRLQKNVGAAFPLLLIKPRDSRGRVSISNKAASLVDIPNTILGDLQLPLLPGGADLFALGEDEQRLRRYRDYVVSNDAFSPQSWRHEPMDAAISDAPVAVIRKGDTVKFGATGLGHQFRQEGWSGTRWAGTRSRLRPARLRMKLGDGANHEIEQLEFNVKFGKTDVLPIHYSINDGAPLLLEVVPDEKQNARFAVPVDDVPANQEITLTFHFTIPDDLPQEVTDRFGFFLREMVAN